MTGRAEVKRLEQILDATFRRATGLQGDAELLSDFARYLCILVSGFLEQSVQELVLEYARRTASPAVQRYVASRIRGFTNANAQRLLDLVGSFDPDWRIDLEIYLVDERKAAVDSVIDLRNTISHGRYAGVTMSRITEYYKHVRNVIDHMSARFDPV